MLKILGLVFYSNSRTLAYPALTRKHHWSSDLCVDSGPPVQPSTFGRNECHASLEPSYARMLQISSLPLFPPGGQPHDWSYAALRLTAYRAEPALVLPSSYVVVGRLSSYYVPSLVPCAVAPVSLCWVPDDSSQGVLKSPVNHSFRSALTSCSPGDGRCRGLYDHCRMFYRPYDASCHHTFGHPFD